MFQWVAGKLQKVRKAQAEAPVVIDGKTGAVVGLASAGLLVSGSSFAVSIVDYTSIMTQVTTELGLGITAAVVGIGIIWGARIGVRFVKSLLT